VILLDTHIWVWWVDDNQQLTDRQRHIIQANAQSGLGISAITCWEVANLVEHGQLELACPIEEWKIIFAGAVGAASPERCEARGCAV
jgi:PIN domain nuclease of toxin-antitoxin system